MRRKDTCFLHMRRGAPIFRHMCQTHVYQIMLPRIACAKFVEKDAKNIHLFSQFFFGIMILYLYF